MTIRMDAAALQEILKNTPMFSLFSADEFQELAAAFESVRYPLGQMVFRAGDASDAFYVVAEGRARVIAEKGGDEVTVGTLNRGDHLGEQGLINDARREFTVRSAGDLTLLRLRKSDFDRLLDRHPDLTRYFGKYVSELAIRNFLKLCTVFAPLSARDTRDLLGSLEIRDYAADQTIVREGDPGDAFFILRSGSCAVVKESQDRQVVNRLRAGDCFGELALLMGQPRAASVIAQEPTSVFRMPKQAFDRVVAAAPKVKEAIVGLASGYGGTAPAPAPEPEPEPVLDLPTAPAPEIDKSYRPKRAHRLPALLQLTEQDCGPACLAMVLRYYGKRVALHRLRTLAAAGRSGSSLYQLAEAGEALGFQTRGIETSLDRILSSQLPAVAHWEGTRFVVLYESGPDGVVIADPAVGLRRISSDEFRRGWSGHLLLLTAHAEDRAGGGREKDARPLSASLEALPQTARRDFPGVGAAAVVQPGDSRLHPGDCRPRAGAAQRSHAQRHAVRHDHRGRVPDGRLSRYASTSWSTPRAASTWRWRWISTGTRLACRCVSSKSAKWATS